MIEVSVLNVSSRSLFPNTVSPVDSSTSEVMDNSSSRIPSQAVNIPDPVQ